MTIFKRLLLILTLSFFGELSSSWAMMQSLEEKDVKTSTSPKKRKEESPHKEAKKQKTKIPTSQMPQIPQEELQQQVLKQPGLLQKSTRPQTFFDQFKDILAAGPNPIQAMTEITAQQEDQKGSRKWVKSFNNPDAKDAHDWHTKMSKTIVSLREENQKEKYLPVETNFAAARLVFILQDGETKVVDIPYFFISGWPANANRESAKRFAKDLNDKKLGASLKDYDMYGLRFITKSYQGKEEKELRKPNYDPYKDEIKEIMEKELKEKESIPAKERLDTHIKLMSANDSGILGKLYFHSEQSIWMTAKEEIEKVKTRLNNKKKGDITSFLSSSPKVDPLARVFLDICSFYDMCWCCGDTLASCCHTKTLGAQVYVRASGCSAYYDRPFEHKPPYALRDHRKEFNGYEEGCGFEMPSNTNGNLYKPYINHSMASDFQ